MDLQLFAKKSRMTADGLIGYSTRISVQKQDAHIFGTKEYLRRCNNEESNSSFKPGIMTVDGVHAFINEKSGTGKIYRHPDGGLREQVESKDVVGQYWNNRKSKYEDTTTAEIVYGKTGTHVFPKRI